MKQIIEIPDQIRSDILNDGVLYVDYEPTIRDAIKNGIVLPDNATNMDVLLSIFPDLTVDVEHPLLWHYDKERKKNTMLCDMFDRDWLNEPYETQIETIKNKDTLNESERKICDTCRNLNSHNGVCDICHDHRCWTPKNGWTKEKLERHGK